MTDPEYRVLSRHALLARVQGGPGCLDNLITDQLRDFGPGVPDRHKGDRVIFADAKIIATIRKGGDGSAVVTRFEG